LELNLRYHFIGPETRRITTPAARPIAARSIRDNQIQIVTSRIFGKKTPPKDHVSSEALVVKKKDKIKTGTSSRRWRSVARGYW